MTSIIHINERDQVKATVLDQLDVERVLQAYGVRFRRAGGRNQVCSADCPASRHSDNDSFRFDVVKKLWQCFKCNTHGDIFHYIAAMEGVDCGREFPRVMVRAAELADVDLGATRNPEWLAQNEQREREREARYRAQLEEDRVAANTARGRAATSWDSFHARSEFGERYLASRGLRDVPDFVRFDHAGAANPDGYTSEGAPSLAVRAFDDGGICGVVRRRIPPIRGFRPSVKAPTLTGTSGTGSLGDAVGDIRIGGEVIVLEGIVDTITARVAWPHATVLGANGTGPLHQVIFHAAKRAKPLGARLHIAPHTDSKQQGQKAVERGLKMARAVGMKIGDDVFIVDLGGAKDLNDAYRAGWRPS